MSVQALQSRWQYIFKDLRIILLTNMLMLGHGQFMLAAGRCIKGSNVSRHVYEVFLSAVVCIHASIHDMIYVHCKYVRLFACACMYENDCMDAPMYECISVAMYVCVNACTYLY